MNSTAYHVENVQRQAVEYTARLGAVRAALSGVVQQSVAKWDGNNAQLSAFQ
jgi:hypothetical protein